MSRIRRRRGDKVAPVTSAGPKDIPDGAGRVLAEFLRLGLTAFGGPVAHIGYFRERFVGRLKWLDEAAFADLVALCKFLPGPASSQLGMAIGLTRAGLPGALAAFVGFTAPSAILMTLLGVAVIGMGPGGVDRGVLAGLAIVALAVVAEAVRGMAAQLARGRLHAAIALGAAALALAFPGASTQIAILLAGGLAGWGLDRAPPPPAASHRTPPIGRRQGAKLLGLFAALLAGLPLIATLWPDRGLVLVDAFYRSGALVFGGGHVVLPLLQSAVVANGLVTEPAFVAGYGAVQAVPGPLFSIAAYLGAIASLHGPLVGALIATLALFAPAFLLVTGALPFWLALGRIAACRKALAGINAAVVGLLGAALYDPVFTTAVHNGRDLALAVIAYAMLTTGRVPAYPLVLLAALTGYLLHRI